MDLVRKSSALIISTAYLMLVACDSPPPRKPMTELELYVYRERMISKAVQAAYRAGQDGTAVYERLELQACYGDAWALPDVAQRSPAIQQCRITWPQPQQPVTTNCYSAGGNTRCTSQ
jgi:hypothetical protein